MERNSPGAESQHLAMSSKEFSAARVKWVRGRGRGLILWVLGSHGECGDEEKQMGSWIDGQRKREIQRKSEGETERRIKKRQINRKEKK